MTRLAGRARPHVALLRGRGAAIEPTRPSPDSGDSFTDLSSPASERARIVRSERCGDVHAHPRLHRTRGFAWLSALRLLHARLLRAARERARRLCSCAPSSEHHAERHRAEQTDRASPPAAGSLLHREIPPLLAREYRARRTLDRSISRNAVHGIRLFPRRCARPFFLSSSNLSAQMTRSRPSTACTALRSGARPGRTPIHLASTVSVGYMQDPDAVRVKLSASSPEVPSGLSSTALVRLTASPRTKKKRVGQKKIRRLTDRTR